LNAVSDTSGKSDGKRARGRFITLEGGEGTGKSTQIQRLVARLASIGIETVATREPGGSPAAEKLREIILSGFVEPLGAVAETLAFSAARIAHLDNTIRPALAEGCFVVCDRFMDSTRAYQGALGDVDPALIEKLEKAVVGDTRPDLTIILDLPTEEGLARAGARRGEGYADRFESEEIEFHDAVRKAFLKIAASEPERCARVYAGKSADEVEADIWKIVSERLLGEKSIAPTEAQHGKAAAKPRARMPRGPNLRVVSGKSTEEQADSTTKNSGNSSAKKPGRKTLDSA
jgi:dTMP kinase